MKTPEEAYSIKLISDVHVNSGKAYFIETWIENNEYRSAILMYDGISIKEISFSKREKMPIINNGRLIYVKYDKEKEEIFSLEQLSEPKLLASFKKIKKIEPYGESLLVIAEEDANKDLPFYATKLKYKFDSRGLLRSRSHLYLVSENKVRRITKGDFDIIDVATNGKRVAVIATLTNDDYGLSDVYEVDVYNSELKRITKGEGIGVAIAMSKYGDVAYLGHRKGLAPWANLEIILPEFGKSFSCSNTCGNKVLTDLFDGVTDRIIWDNDLIYTLGQVKGSSLLYRISIEGKPEPVTSEGISVRGFHVKDGEIAYFYTTQVKPSILNFKGNIYDPNPNVLGREAERFEVDGIEGWAIIVNRDNPSILFIHGGPHMAYGNAFYIEFQFLAANGFNIIFCNPRGSQGYGEEFARAIVGRWGEIDYEDIMKFLNHIVKSKGLNDNICITGGSYGGYLTNWIITKTDKFKCAVAERSISNLVSMSGTSDIGFWFNTIESGINDPWLPENIEKLLKMSPIYYVKNVKTPCMLIHGEEDYRCSIEQAEQFFTALKMNNVDTVLIRYQNDTHEHARRGRPENMKDRLTRKLEWFRKYLTIKST
jgi:dipeptidyl aminopeptidase/acylaminoacyl peptidase